MTTTYDYDMFYISKVIELINNQIQANQVIIDELDRKIKNFESRLEGLND